MRVLKLLVGGVVSVASLTDAMDLHAGVITFDDLSIGTNYTLPASATLPATPPTTSLTSDGVQVYLDFTLDILGVPVVPAGPGEILNSFNGSPNALSLNNSIFYIDFIANGLGPMAQVTFDYRYMGGNNRANVNNLPRLSGASIATLPAFPAFLPHGGSVLTNNITAVNPGSADGTFTFTADSLLIESVAFGGQELLIDNITFTPVPEPMAAVMLGLGAFAFVRRR